MPIKLKALAVLIVAVAALCLLAGGAHGVEATAGSSSCASDAEHDDGAMCATNKAVKEPPVSALDFMYADAILKADVELAKDRAIYSKLATAEQLAKVVAALKAKHHTVRVFNTGKEALDYLDGQIPDGSTVSWGFSTTLKQIGFLDALKKRNNTLTNWKGRAYEAAQEGNFALYGELLQQGYTAAFYLSSVSAISEAGDIYGVDASGSRIGGWLTSKKLIICAGTNKIVRDEQEAHNRLKKYQEKLEGARVREGKLLNQGI